MLKIQNKTLWILGFIPLTNIFSLFIAIRPSQKNKFRVAIPSFSVVSRRNLFFRILMIRFWSLRFRSFEFVSSFDIRISDLTDPTVWFLRSYKTIL
jgi:hypothetical protein